MKIVVSEFMDETALQGVGPDVEMLYDSTLVDNRDALFSALAGACGLIVRNRTQVDKALLNAAPDLRVVGRLGVGLDYIDLDACKDRNVRVKPATGANTLSVAEYVISATLMLVRGAYTSNAAMVAGESPRNALMPQAGPWGWSALARSPAPWPNGPARLACRLPPTILFLPGTTPIGRASRVARCRTC